MITNKIICKLNSVMEEKWVTIGFPVKCLSEFDSAESVDRVSFYFNLSTEELLTVQKSSLVCLLRMLTSESDTKRMEFILNHPKYVLNQITWSVAYGVVQERHIYIRSTDV